MMSLKPMHAVIIALFSSASAFPPRVCAPYVACWTNLSVNTLANNTGNKFYTLAFVISNGTTNSAPYWNGTMALSNNNYVTDLANLRAQGGDVIISFGGQGGSELALVHTSVASLQAAYQQVITKYALKWMDFDIEGSTIFDTAANTRRNLAIRNLQTANPGLFIEYTVPSTSPDAGVTQSTLDLLSNAKRNGARVDVVNVMAMNYDPGICGDMGQYAMNVINHTHTQVTGLGMASTIGITPMIGVNDYACENFTLANTQTVYNYAVANSFVSLLSFWVMDADVNYANVNIFKAFNNLSTGISPLTRRTVLFKNELSIYDLSGRRLPSKLRTVSF